MTIFDTIKKWFSDIYPFMIFGALLGVGLALRDIRQDIYRERKLKILAKNNEKSDDKKN